MKKVFPLLFLVVLFSAFLCVSAFAVDSNDYYIDTSERVASDNLISVLTGSNGWDSTDSQILSNINQNVANIKSYLNNGGTSVASLVYQFYNYFRNTWAPNIGDAVLSIENALTSETDGLAKETTLSTFYDFVYGALNPIQNGSSDTYDALNYRYYLKTPVGGKYVSFGVFLDTFFRSFAYDGNNGFGAQTLYHYVKRLSDVLANDEDKAIRDAQKDNQTTVAEEFFGTPSSSGSSKDSTLGVQDFKDVAGVGGTLKDTVSLNGQASVSSMTSGLSDADSVGQGWFSQANMDALDSVAPTQGVSTFSADGQHMEDVDIYHMAGFDGHYDWLTGGGVHD